MYLATLNNMVNEHQTKPRNYPLLIGCGKYDVPMALSAVERWKNHEPDCKVVIFDYAGHCVNMDVSTEFNVAMEEFWANSYI